MDYHKYFEQLREKHLKLKRDLDDCVQNHANNMATIYINKIIDNIEKKNEDFVKNGSIETMIDKFRSRRTARSGRREAAAGRGRG